MCHQCGAPFSVDDAGGNIRCEYCDSALQVAPKRTGRIRFPDPSLTPDLSPQKHEKLRLKQLKKQREHYDGKANPYSYHKPPPGLDSLSGLPQFEPKTLEVLQKAFGVAIEACKASRGYVRDQRAVTWTARRLGTLHNLARDPQRARAAYETALEGVIDPGYQQVLRCALSRLACRVDDVTSAEAWLEPCDPRPVILDLDSAYRTAQAELLLTRGESAAEEVLVLLGERRKDVPYDPSSVLMFFAGRVSALELLGRSKRAQDEWSEIVNRIDDQKFLYTIVSENPGWKPAMQAWERMGISREVR